MKYLTIIFLLVISAGLLQCREDSTTNVTEPITTEPIAATPDVVLDDLREPFVIRYNKTILIKDENLLIKFIKVTEGRCPTGAECFWEGQAIGDFLLCKVNVGWGIASPIIRPSQSPDREYGDLADDAVGYRLFLLELKPYPHVGRDTDPEQYVAKLRVEKLPEK